MIKIKISLGQAFRNIKITLIHYSDLNMNQIHLKKTMLIDLELFMNMKSLRKLQMMINMKIMNTQQQHQMSHRQ